MITDQDIELLDQKVCLFNTLESFTKPALECEDGLHVMMCTHPFVLFEKEVMERGYLSDFSDFLSSIPSKLLSSPTKILKNFICDPFMTESIVDNCGAGNFKNNGFMNHTCFGWVVLALDSEIQ